MAVCERDVAQRGVSFVMSRERRRLFEEEDESAEPGHFGCSMLTRSHFTSRPGSGIKTMRCALGWALHNDLEVARCCATDSLTDCWKVHPERTPVVVLPGMERDDNRQPAPAKAAGD